MIPSRRDSVLVGVQPILRRIHVQVHHVLRFDVDYYWNDVCNTGQGVPVVIMTSYDIGIRDSVLSPLGAFGLQTREKPSTLMLSRRHTAYIMKYTHHCCYQDVCDGLYIFVCVAGYRVAILFTVPCNPYTKHTTSLYRCHNIDGIIVIHPHQP